MAAPTGAATRARAGFNFTGPFAGLGNLVLGIAGIKKAEREPPSARAKPTDFKEGMPIEMQLWLGARLPAITGVIILGCFTYAYHIVPVLPWLLVFFTLDFAIIVTWPPKQIGTKVRDFMSWTPMLSWLLAVGFATVVGLINYGLLEAWVNTAFLHEYHNVLPSADPMAMSDGGVLNFAVGTRLDIDKAAGYKFWLYNYCAAPVVGASPSATPVSFWAVGVGCCKNRGHFECDSAGDSNARSAMPLREYNLTPEIVGHYDKAIAMAAAANGLEVAKDKMFVIWHKDPKGFGKWRWWMCTVIFLTLVLVAVCLYQALSSAIYWKANLVA